MVLALATGDSQLGKMFAAVICPHSYTVCMGREQLEYSKGSICISDQQHSPGHTFIHCLAKFI